MPVSTLLPDPAELRLDHLLSEPESITIVVATARPTACCPACQHPSTRVHSRYVRSLADLNGLTVLLELKGYEPDQAQAKHNAARRWVAAVTNWQGLGQ